jgi:SpoVK/Ycf46/Vps4 family AAA+-type ATPase
VQAHSPSYVPEQVKQLVIEAVPRRRLSDLILPGDVRESIAEFLHEYAHAELLRAHSIEPRHTVLLIGPPGNGKTSLAEVIAAELGLLFLTVRYDAIVDSYLGETASRIRKVIDFASTIPCLLFFDEFDAVGKERGDAHETGEIKRVVSSLLVQMDALPAQSVLVCATNHPELLDRAVWRRFELKLEIPMPGPDELQEWFRRFEHSIGGKLNVTAAQFSKRMAGTNFAEVEAFTLDVRRKLVLSMGDLKPSDALRAVLDRWSKQQRVGAEYNNVHADRSPDHKAAPPTSKRKKVPRPPPAHPTPDLLSDTD